MQDRKLAVILCGGFGSRMDNLTKNKAKALIEVCGKPLIVHTIEALVKNGFDTFIFPLGFQGKALRIFLSNFQKGKPLVFNFVETGEDNPIHNRMRIIQDLIQEDENFLLCNSDTIFDFDIKTAFMRHVKNNFLISLFSVEIASPWGLIHTESGKLVDFSRERRIKNLVIGSGPGRIGHINSGISIINKNALFEMDYENCKDFEEDLFNKAIGLDRASFSELEGVWHPVDTKKDLQVAEKMFSGIQS